MADRKHAKLRSLAPRIRSLELRTALPPEKTADTIYRSPEWRALVERLIVERARICQDVQCPTPGRWQGRLIADHVVEIKDGGAPLDPRNVLLRCSTCHARKTAREAAARMRAPAGAS